MVASKFWIYFIGLATTCFRYYECLLSDFSFCHNDLNLNPQDGLLAPNTFNWLGYVQYLHTTTGLPHHSSAPRVVLIHRQFALGTAHDLVRVPTNFELGHVIFADYERDEDECNLTFFQIKFGMKCTRAYLEMPYSEIIPHPEFTRFGVGNSLAVIKLMMPMKSNYMLPICLPTLTQRETLRGRKTVFVVDYTDSVPIDLNAERMGKKTVRLFTYKECKRHRGGKKLGTEGLSHVLCTSGCGMRSGTPIVAHSHAGPFELIGLAIGGARCAKRRHRFRLNPEPPLFMDIYPYRNWIINVISAHIMPQVYPAHMLTTAGTNIQITREGPVGWQGHAYAAGKVCFDSSARKNTRNIIFYYERFKSSFAPAGADLNMYMHLIAPPEYTIVCAKVGLPNQKIRVKVEGINGRDVLITIHTGYFPRDLSFDVTLFARNETALWDIHGERWSKFRFPPPQPAETLPYGQKKL